VGAVPRTLFDTAHVRAKANTPAQTPWAGANPVQPARSVRWAGDAPRGRYLSGQPHDLHGL